MDEDPTKQEQIDMDDRKRREDALANPQKFFPRPEDVLLDDSLSPDEKRTLLNNWRVQLEDRGGALEPGTHAVDTEDDDRSMHAAVADALARLEGHRQP
jgi:hypothetical protein